MHGLGNLIIGMGGFPLPKLPAIKQESSLGLVKQPAEIEV